MSNIAEKIEKNDSSIAERSFIQSILVSVITILVSLACLTAATWAWCSEDMSSAGNTIQAASYELDIKVLDPDGIALTPSADGLASGYHIYHFEAGEKYTVILTANGTASNCYCIVTVDGINYYTNLIPTSESENNPSRYVIKTDRDVEIKFDLRWGIHNEEIDINNNDSWDLTEETTEN